MGMGKYSNKILIKKDLKYTNFLFFQNGIGFAERIYRINLFLTEENEADGDFSRLSLVNNWLHRV